MVFGAVGGVGEMVLERVLGGDRCARRRRGVSVAAVIREAIDRAVGGDVGSRAEAAAELLAAPPMEVGEWAEEKRRLADELSGGGGAAGGDDGRAA